MEIFNLGVMREEPVRNSNSKYWLQRNLIGRYADTFHFGVFSKVEPACVA